MWKRFRFTVTIILFGFVYFANTRDQRRENYNARRPSELTHNTERWPVHEVAITKGACQAYIYINS